MNEIQTLTHPTILDVEALHEFSDALADRVLDIERDIAKLNRAPESRNGIADIFRMLHSIKGDAALCSVPLAELVVHPLESLLTRLRSGDVHYTQLLGEVILLAIDRLELATEALVAGRPVAQLRLVALVEGLGQLSRASPGDLEPGAAQLIKTLTGLQPHSTLQALVGQPSRKTILNDSKANDLRFFRSLALQYESRSPRFAGRTDRIHQLALETNLMAGLPVDEVQLEAAAYLHDIGMMFLPESVWLKIGKISKEERIALQSHPELAAGLIDRMEGWQGAAEMIRQHHETWDGKGYPNGLKGDAICPGAKILSIVDAFEAVMLKLDTRSHSSCVLRAIAEVNACDQQFAPEWIEPFNAVIRAMFEPKSL